MIAFSGVGEHPVIAAIASFNESSYDHMSVAKCFFERIEQSRDTAGHPSSILLIFREPEKRRFRVKILDVEERSQS